MSYDLLHEEKQYLNFLKESVTKRKTLKEDEPQVKIPVKHPGVLDVPEGKNIEDLPYEHFAALAKKKGFGEISKALNNLHVWNKDKHPVLAAWANKMQERLSKEFSEAANECKSLEEKWAKDVDVKSTGQHAGKSIEQLKKEINALKGKPGNKEKMGELLFALRAKQGWKKHTGV